MQVILVKTSMPVIHRATLQRGGQWARTGPVWDASALLAQPVTAILALILLALSNPARSVLSIHCVCPGLPRRLLTVRDRS